MGTVKFECPNCGRPCGDHFNLSKHQGSKHCNMLAVIRSLEQRGLCRVFRTNRKLLKDAGVTFEEVLGAHYPEGKKTTSALWVEHWVHIALNIFCSNTGTRAFRVIVLRHLQIDPHLRAAFESVYRLGDEAKARDYLLYEMRLKLPHP